MAISVFILTQKKQFLYRTKESYKILNYFLIEKNGIYSYVREILSLRHRTNFEKNRLKWSSYSNYSDFMTHQFLKWLEVLDLAGNKK